MTKKEGKKIYKIAVYAVGVLIFAASGFLYSCTAKKGDVYSVSQSTQTELEPTDNVTEGTKNADSGGSDDTNSTALDESTETTVFVYVCGNVVNPGVYEALENSRVYELIDMAGGVTQDGCLEALNLAEHVYDGQKLYVPNHEEYENNGSISYEQEQTENGAGGLVNINTAGLEQLMTLPGIGASRAQAIIEYRNVNGMFGSIEDIMGVSGIKESAFSKIKDYICVK